MEDLSTALFYDTVPDTWVARAYPSMMGLAAWYADLLLRIRVSSVPSEPPPTSDVGTRMPGLTPHPRAFRSRATMALEAPGSRSRVEGPGPAPRTP